MLYYLLTYRTVFLSSEVSILEVIKVGIFPQTWILKIQTQCVWETEGFWAASDTRYETKSWRLIKYIYYLLWRHESFIIWYIVIIAESYLPKYLFRNVWNGKPSPDRNFLHVGARTPGFNRSAPTLPVRGNAAEQQHEKIWLSLGWLPHRWSQSQVQNAFNNF